MVRTINQSDAHINYRIASEDTFFHCFTHTFFNCGDVLTRNSATEDFINEFEAASGGQRFHSNFNVTILTMTTGLFFMFAFNFCSTTDGFTVFDDGSSQVSFYTKFTLHTFHDNFDVLVAHTGNQGFFGYRVFGNDDGRIFVHQTSQCSRDFVFVAFFLSIDCASVHRQRECDGREFNVCSIFVAEGVTGGGKLQFSNNTDIACYNFFHRDLSFTAHSEDSANAFFFFTTGVEYYAIALNGAGEYTEEAQTTYERVRGSFEYQCGHRSVGVADFFFASFFIHNDKVVQNCRISKVNDCVHQTAETDIFVSTATNHREDGSLTDTFNEAFHDFFIRNGFAVQITHHAIIVSFYCCFNHFFASFFSCCFIFFRNFNFVRVVTVCTISFHFVKVDYAFKVFSGTQGQFKRKYAFAEFATEVIENAIEVSVFAVHFIYEDNAGKVCFFRKFPALFSTNLYAGGSANNDQCAVYCSKCAFNFCYEVSKTRSIDKVDFGVAPFNRSQSSVYGNFAFNFFRFIVSGGSTVFNFAHSGDSTGTVQ